MNLFVVVGGPPASGKSTVAAAIAPKLRLPLLAKDVVKDALFDALGEPDDLARSRRLGRAAVHAVLALAYQQRGAVLDSTWYPYAIELARGLPAPVVEVRCVVPEKVARERYVRRMPSRRDGHLQEQRTPDELWDPMLRRPTGLGPVPHLVATHRLCDAVAPGPRTGSETECGRAVDAGLVRVAVVVIEGVDGGVGIDGSRVRHRAEQERRHLGARDSALRCVAAIGDASHDAGGRQRVDIGFVRGLVVVVIECVSVRARQSDCGPFQRPSDEGRHLRARDGPPGAVATRRCTACDAPERDAVDRKLMRVARGDVGEAVVGQFPRTGATDAASR